MVDELMWYLLVLAYVIIAVSVGIVCCELYILFMKNKRKGGD